MRQGNETQPDGLRLTLCDLTKNSLAADFPRVLSRLDSNTAEKILRYRRESDRQLALAREVLLSGILRERFAEDDVILERNAYGKPFVKDRDFHFSISHSGSLVAIAFGKEQHGVDVEQIGGAGDPFALCGMLSPGEQARIKSAAHPEKEFCRVWTWREALSKEEGIGLALFDHCQPEIDYDRHEATLNGKKLYFREYDYPRYQLTLCADSPCFPETYETVNRSKWNAMAESYRRIIEI